MTFFRLKQVAIGLAVAAGLASGCALAHMGGAGSVQTASLEIPIELVSDGSGGCKKNGKPPTPIAREGQTVVWKITNHCGIDATVQLKGFSEKHRFLGGPHPFADDKPSQAPMSVANNQTLTIEATVRPKNQVGDDETGFHVYKYAVKIKPGRDEDPEIIIEWP